MSRVIIEAKLFLTLKIHSLRKGVKNASLGDRMISLLLFEAEGRFGIRHQR